MLPQINPYYFQQPNYQMQNYTPQYQNFPQNVAQINGRLVDSIDNVTANDVPMTGISVFPKNDMSEVYIKSWQNDGTIKTLKFALQSALDNSMGILSSKEVDGAKRGDSEEIKGVLERLEIIEEKLDKILRPVKGKKEVCNEP